MNRSLSWVFAVGYVLVHYLWPIRHGEGDIMSMDPIPRIFFMTSFVWMSAHVWVAWRMYGPPKLRVKTLKDFYVLDASLVLLVTTPIFSIPALGASPLLMIIAWPPLAAHLALNVWFLCGRARTPLFRTTPFRIGMVGLWMAWVAGAAIRSFPHV